jgi:drug/metabolite transporter (DMT)-like permease
LTFAILALVNRRNVRISDPVAVAFFQNLFAALCLVIPVVLIQPRAPAATDLPALIFLGVVCTALSHTLFISSLKQIRAQTASVITGLEPVYGIVLAFLLLNEIPTISTLAGGGIIIGASVAAGYLASSKRTAPQNQKKVEK